MKAALRIPALLFVLSIPITVVAQTDRPLIYPGANGATQLTLGNINTETQSRQSRPSPRVESPQGPRAPRSSSKGGPSFETPF